MNKAVITYHDGCKTSVEHVNEVFDKVTIEGTDENDIIISDGHHTFEELYDHRYALYAALCKIYDNYITPFNTRVAVIKSKLHHDGTMFDGWFIVMMLVKKFDGTTDQISYHLPLTWWDKFKVTELNNAPEWDGHNSEDVLIRLLEL